MVMRDPEVPGFTYCANVPRVIAIETILRIIRELGGHATCFATGQTQPFQPLAAPLLRYQRQLKNQLDPQGIFNPGRMYAEV